MSGAVKSVVKELNPIKHVKNTFKNIKEGNWEQAVLDPGDAFGPPIEDIKPGEGASIADEGASIADDVIETPEPEIKKKAAETAAEEARRRNKKKKKTTQTVLTSPLGATTTAKTAVTKLGGA